MNKTIPAAILIMVSLKPAAQAADTSVRSVHIGFSYSPAIFPQSWVQPPIKAYAEDIFPEEVPRSKTIISKGLDKYPEATLKHLLAVYFLRQIKFYGVAYGGTNSSNTIYLVNEGAIKGYTDKYLEQTFHHEFSSILFRNFPSLLDTNQWKNANRPDFIYNDPENGVGAIRNNQSSQDLDTSFCTKGVLTQYGGSSMENDINTFAQNLFRPDENFWDYVERFPRIGEKTRLLIKFYTRIHPLFTEKYFRNFEHQ